MDNDINSINRNLVANKFTFDQTNNNSNINSPYSPDKISELHKIDFNLPNEFKNLIDKIKNDKIESIMLNIKNKS